MSEDNFPFDRPHWTVSVSFPVSHLAKMEELENKVAELADKRGGRPAGSSRPTAEFLGRSGYETFGFAVAFEAGDVNADGFIRMAQDKFKDLGVTIDHDPEAVTYPAEEDFRPRR